MPFDISIIEEAIQILRRPSSSPPGSVTKDGLVMHEILGGQGDRPRLFGPGYFLAWAHGDARPKLENSQETGEPGERLADFPSFQVVNEKFEPVAGFPIRFTVIEGGGFLEDGQSVVEEFSGDGGTVAVSSWTLGPAAGVNRVRAEGFGISLDFTVTTTNPS